VKQSIVVHRKGDTGLNGNYKTYDVPYVTLKVKVKGKVVPVLN